MKFQILTGCENILVFIPLLLLLKFHLLSLLTKLLYLKPAEWLKYLGSISRQSFFLSITKNLVPSWLHLIDFSLPLSWRIINNWKKRRIRYILKFWRTKQNPLMNLSYLCGETLSIFFDTLKRQRAFLCFSVIKIKLRSRISYQNLRHSSRVCENCSFLNKVQRKTVCPPLYTI